MSSRIRWSGVFGVLMSLLALGACGDGKDDGDDSAADAGGGNDQDGSVDEGPLVPPLELGEAIEAPDKTWTWVDFPETRCMNDSATGLGVRLNEDSDKVLIVIQGGGACFNALTCLIVINSNGFNESNLAVNVDKGLLNPDDADNPFADWNMVFIPYCSGDTFTGNALNGSGYGADASGKGGKTQAGYKNFQEYLKRLVPTFKDSSHVVLSGYSAGGFAASVNWVQAREAWGKGKRVDVLNDSGPPMGPKYLTPCMQQRLAKTWNWAGGTVPTGCKECDIESGNVTEPSIRWSIPHTQDGRHALISSDEDTVIKRFYGYGQNDCAGFDGAGSNFTVGQYAEGLEELRETFKDHPGAAAFVIKSTMHVWTMQSPGAVTSNGVVLRDWIEDFLDPDAEFDNVVP